MANKNCTGANGGWNYRMFRRSISIAAGDEVVEFYVGEAYYDDDGKIDGWYENPIYPLGDTRKALMNDLAHYTSAMSQPYIDLTVDPPEEVGLRGHRKAIKLTKHAIEGDG